MYISCFSNNFVPLKKFFPVDSRNDLNIIRTGQKLIEAPTWDFICWGRCFELEMCDIEASLHWRVVLQIHPLGGFFQGGGLYRAKGIKRESQPRAPGNSWRFCALVSRLGSHTNPREGKGQEFGIFQCCSVSHPAGWCTSSSSLTSCVWPLCWGGSSAGLGALGGRPHIPVDRNVLLARVPFYLFFFSLSFLF